MILIHFFKNGVERVQAVGKDDVRFAAAAARGLEAGDQGVAALLAPDVAHEDGRAELADARAGALGLGPEAEGQRSWTAGLQARIGVTLAMRV